MSARNVVGWSTFIAVMVGGIVVVHAGSQMLPDTQAILRFQRAADDYAFAHRRIERRLPSLEVTADVTTIQRAIAAMAAAVRVARTDAREGDLFNPPLQPILRARIVKAMRQHELTIADLEPEDLRGGVAPLAVNGDMPWRFSSAMPACIVEALPALPPELQYRFVGPDLVLVDVHANLIVDILRDAAIPFDTIR